MSEEGQSEVEGCNENGISETKCRCGMPFLTLSRSHCKKTSKFGEHFPQKLSIFLSLAAFLFSFVTFAFTFPQVRQLPPVCICQNAENMVGTDDQAAPSGIRFHGNHGAKSLLSQDLQPPRLDLFQRDDTGRAPADQGHQRHSRDVNELFSRQKRKASRKGPSGKGKSKSKGKSHRVASAHFVPKDFSKEGFPQGGSCLEYNKVHVCRNWTIKTRAPNYTFGFWELSGDRQLTGKRSKSLVGLENGQNIQIKKSGFYYVYNQIVYLKAMYRVSQAIYVNDGQKFRCVESGFPPFDICPDFSGCPQPGVSYQTCSANGFLYLKRGDLLSVRFPYSNSEIALNTDTTYFGIVHLSK